METHQEGNAEVSEDEVKEDGSMDKRTVYIESSVISYCTSMMSRDLIIAARQAITQDWWNRQLEHYSTFVSPVVEREISLGDQETAAIDCCDAFSAHNF